MDNTYKQNDSTHPFIGSQITFHAGSINLLAFSVFGVSDIITELVIHKCAKHVVVFSKNSNATTLHNSGFRKTRDRVTSAATSIHDSN